MLECPHHSPVTYPAGVPSDAASAPLPTYSLIPPPKPITPHDRVQQDYFGPGNTDIDPVRHFESGHAMGAVTVNSFAYH